MIRARFPSVLLLSFLLTGQVRAQTPQIEAAAYSASALVLSISCDGPPEKLPSIFLADRADKPVFKTIHDGQFSGVKTAAGQLLIDRASGQWTLRDSAGRTLIPVSPSATGNPAAKSPDLMIPIAWPAGTPVGVYGCGNNVDALVQHEGRTHVGNGRAAIPFYWSPAGYAVFIVTGIDNSPAQWTSESDRITWTVPGTRANVYLMPARTLRDACIAYTDLTGRPPVPPEWTFGYLQSRWGWKDRAYIDDTLHEFIDRKLPVDAFIFDFEWYTTSPDYTLPPEGKEDFQDFRWNAALFPDPANQIEQMHAQEIHFVGIRKPRLGNSALLTMAHEKDWILPPGKGIDARCLNFARADVRDWYAQQTIPLLNTGIDGWWDDEGELTYTTYYYWNQAQAQALGQVRPEARLWTIDRAFQPGLQRFGAAAWTGDIDSTWESLQRVPTDILNWSLAGMFYGACDIGGFKKEDTPEMLTRWMQVGVFLPVMRAHSVFNVQPRFPWLYGPDAEAAIRKALNLRYRLIPYYYSLAHQAHDTGVPLMRPMTMEFPNDPAVADLTSQWLMGANLLAAPILRSGFRRSVYLPAERWYLFDSSTHLNGPCTLDVAAALDEIPLYVRAGTILPLAGPILHTADLPGGPLELQIYPGKNAAFTLIEDDGQSTAYLKGQIRRTSFTWDDAHRKLTWKIEGPYRGPDIFTSMNVTVFDESPTKLDGQSLRSDGAVVMPR